MGLTLLGTLLLALNRQIAEKFFQSEGVDPRWALVPLLCLFAYELLKTTHRLYLQEFERAQQARQSLLLIQEGQATTPTLTDDVLRVEQTALPVTDAEFGYHVGTCLGLRCTNMGEHPLSNCRFRVLSLDRHVHDGEWEQEDFFRASFLLWEGGKPCEMIVPGGQRICEVAKQHEMPQFTIVPRSSPGKGLLGGRWRVSVDLEADERRARRMSLHFEWRQPSAIDPGGALRWLVPEESPTNA